MECYTAMKKNVFDFCTNMKSSPEMLFQKKEMVNNEASKTAFMQKKSCVYLCTFE